MRPRKLAATFACLIVFVTAPHAARAQTFPDFQPLGLGPGGIQSFAWDVSANGSVVIGNYWVPNHPFCRFPGTGDCIFFRHGFRWEAGIFQDLGALNPNAVETQPLAVSDDGSKVVGWSRAISGFQRPFLWTAAGGMQEPPNIPGEDAIAFDISPDGAVIVGWYLPFGSGYHSYRWSAGVATDLGFLPGEPDIKAEAVCGPGSAVVGQTTLQGHAFRWRPNIGMENLGLGYAEGCSDDGSVVVGTSTAKGSLAARWDPKGLRTLGTLGGDSSDAHAVSADGAVVVGGAGLPFVALFGSEFTAFRWTAGKMSQLSRVLESLGVTTPFCHAVPCPDGTFFLNLALGISADGSTIVGFGFAQGPERNLEAFRAVVPRANACTPTTCAAQGKNCGTISDGCGGTLTCGACTAPQSCGGGGIANVCGTATTCTPTTCAAQGKNCGTISDGCGGTLTCGACTAPQTCGGGGIANVCGTGITSACSAGFIQATLTVNSAAGAAAGTVVSNQTSANGSKLTVSSGQTASACFQANKTLGFQALNNRIADWSGSPAITCKNGNLGQNLCEFALGTASQSVTSTLK